ncbi:DUF3710 domain-containing protein [Yimella sp. cx-573]|nr:DUF3710 domain-containing protein [Yimella sp. cx-573]
MGIFRRKDKTEVEPSKDVTPEAEEAVADDQDVVVSDEVEANEANDADADVADEAEVTVDDEQPEDAPKARINSRDVDRSSGPYDRTEVDDLDGRLDFGSVAITPIADMELRVDIDEASQQFTGLTAIVGESACQLQVFAAPKSTGVWDDIRGEIYDNLLGSGGEAQEKTGDLGVELHVRMPAQGADGRTTYSPATFVGVDGPRWFLRAVFSGKAAMDEGVHGEMLEFVKGCVVTRGGEPRAPRELLPLTLPEATETEADPAVEDADDDQVPNPFERGPEITEVR